MFCSSCKTNNPAGAKFCVECGTAFALRCPGCGEEARPQAKFCAGCGERLDAVSPELDRRTGGGVPSGQSSSFGDGERRHLTVLFCDLVNSTEIASRLDPEQWHVIAARYQRTAAEAVTAMGGHVAKYLGDGLVVYFGYPEAKENAAECAVRAGLAVVASMAGLNEQFARAHGVILTVRVGIHTGSVVVAQGGGVEPDMFGEAPNIAARVQAAAAPDTVVLTEAVHDLVSGLFVVEDCGDHALKGIDRPVKLYRAISGALATARTRGFAAREQTPFVGREDEIHLLASRWARVRDGDGQFVLVTGEPGIGKTRLTEEFRARIKTDPHLWIECGGAPLFAQTTFHPVTQMLHKGLGWRGDESREERGSRLEPALAALAPQLGEAAPLIAELLDLPVPETSPPLALAPDQRRRRLLDALAGWLFSAPPSQPIVLVVEDLHWVDPSTMELIQVLAEQGGTAALMLVCTARPEFRPPWPARAHHAQIMLNRLNSRDTRELVAGVIARAGLAKDVVDAVITRTDGVPLFAEELTRLMLDGEGGLRAHDIPATLQDSLSARLDRLGGARDVAQLGSVLGREFSFELLQAVSPMPQAMLHSALAKLADAELIHVRGSPPDASYRFRHALILDAAYAALLKSKRRELHGRVAQTITDRFPALAEAQPEVLARHWAEAGEIDRAVSAWSEAGRRAASRAAHVEAAGHLRAALDLLRQKPPDDARARAELPLLTRLAVSLSASLGYSVPEVGQALSEARAICDALDDMAGLYAVLINICNFEATAGDLEAAEVAARRCEEISEKTGLPAHRIQAQYMVAYVVYSKGDLPEARRYLESSARLYADYDGGSLTFFTPTNPLVESLSTLPIVLYALGETAQAAQRADELIRHARSLGRPYDLAYALGFRTVYDMIARNYEDVLRHSEEALALCEANGFATYKAVASTMQALAIGRLSSVERGLSLFRGALIEMKRLGVLRALGLFVGEAAELQLRAGDVAGALATVDEAIVLSNRSYRICLSPLHRLRAEILARTPGVGRAQMAAALAQAIAIAESQGAKTFAKEAARLMRELEPAPAS